MRIGGNKFDDKQLQPLMEGLKLNTGLVTFDISDAGFSTGGGRSLLAVIADHRTLKQFLSFPSSPFYHIIHIY